VGIGACGTTGQVDAGDDAARRAGRAVAGGVVMPCCHCQGAEDVFDTAVAARELRQYREHGPRATTRILIDALIAAGAEGRTLLDIGGGIGTIQHELLRAGAERADGVEASAAYVAAARDEAASRRHTDRLGLHHGDFVELAPTLPAADIVTLDRVICCYPDMPALVGPSVAHARWLYGVVYPQDRWWVKVGLAVSNLSCRLRGNPFRAYAHSTKAVDALIRRAGFAPRFERRTLVWRVVVYER
jgi:magnesium-protoporphyrin O-methyltransferase